jgi:adenylate cyclase class 2
MSKLVETEVKIVTPDLDAIRQRLEALGAVRVGERVYENNVRYENEDESFTRNGIVLRLRQDTRVRLTYKSPPMTVDPAAGDVTSRLEAEVTVDDFDMMDLILEKLGFHPYVIYEKYRTTYLFDEAEVVLDEMPYGNFIEVEGSAESIDRVLHALELHDRPRVLESYMSLFERVKQALELDVHDLSFANFEGVTVPAEIFTAPR